MKNNDENYGAIREVPEPKVEFYLAPKAESVDNGELVLGHELRMRTWISESKYDRYNPPCKDGAIEESTAQAFVDAWNRFQAGKAKKKVVRSKKPAKI